MGRCRLFIGSVCCSTLDLGRAHLPAWACFLGLLLYGMASVLGNFVASRWCGRRAFLEADHLSERQRELQLMEWELYGRRSASLLLAVALTSPLRVIIIAATQPAPRSALTAQVFLIQMLCANILIPATCALVEATVLQLSKRGNQVDHLLCLFPSLLDFSYVDLPNTGGVPTATDVVAYWERVYDQEKILRWSHTSQA